MRLALSALALVAAACVSGCDQRSPTRSRTTATTREPSPSPGPGFLKGQLHAHTSGSNDSDTPPAEAAAWYAARGYDFVVFTDHNAVTELAPPPGMLLFPGVELTQNYPRCDPPPERGDHCLFHVNALFITPPSGPIRFAPLPGNPRLPLYARAVDQALSMGGLAQLNHPNFVYAADLEILLALAARGLTLVEIANQAVDSRNDGDARHPSTEALWDAALARGARVFGTASDDTHHYNDVAQVRARGEVPYPGDLGFVMVRAEKTAASVRAAITAGDFYASTGVVFERLQLTPASIAVDVRPASPPYTFEVVAGGAVVEASRATSLRFDPHRAGASPVRVRVRDGKGRHAWTQPVWL